MFPIITLRDQKTYETSPIRQFIQAIQQFCETALKQYPITKGQPLTADQTYARTLLENIKNLCTHAEDYLKEEHTPSKLKIFNQTISAGRGYLTIQALKTLLSSGEQTAWSYIQNDLTAYLDKQLKKIKGLHNDKDTIESTIKIALRNWVCNTITKHSAPHTRWVPHTKNIHYLPHETPEYVQEKILALLDLTEDSSTPSHISTPIIYSTITAAELDEKLKTLSHKITTWQLVAVDQQIHDLIDLFSGLFSQLPTDYTQITPFLAPETSQSHFQRLLGFLQKKMPETDATKPLLENLVQIMQNRLVFKTTTYTGAAGYSQDYQATTTAWEKTKQQALDQLSQYFTYNPSEKPVSKDNESLSDRCNRIQKHIQLWEQELEQLHEKQANQPTLPSAIPAQLPAHYVHLKRNMTSGNIEMSLIPLGHAIAGQLTEYQEQLHTASEQLACNLKIWKLELNHTLQQQTHDTEAARIQSYQPAIDSIEQTILAIEEFLSAEWNTRQKPLQEYNELLTNSTDCLTTLSTIIQEIQPISPIITERFLLENLQKLHTPIQLKIPSLQTKLNALTTALTLKKNQYLRNQQQPSSHAPQVLDMQEIQDCLNTDNTKKAAVSNEINELQTNIETLQAKLNQTKKEIQTLQEQQETLLRTAQTEQNSFIEKILSLQSATLPFSNRLLPTLATERGVQGDTERRTGVYTPVHEDSSTVSTKQFTPAVEFPKKSNEQTFTPTNGALAVYGAIQDSLNTQCMQQQSLLAQHTTDYPREITKWVAIAHGMGFTPEKQDPSSQQKFFAKAQDWFKLGSTARYIGIYNTIHTDYFSSETPEISLRRCLQSLEFDDAYITRWETYREKHIDKLAFNPTSKEYQSDEKAFEARIQTRIAHLKEQQDNRNKIQKNYDDLRTIHTNMDTQKPAFIQLLSTIEERRASISKALTEKITLQTNTRQSIDDQQIRLRAQNSELQQYQRNIAIGSALLQLLSNITAYEQSLTSYHIPMLSDSPTKQLTTHTALLQAQDYQQAQKKLASLREFETQLTTIAQQINPAAHTPDSQTSRLQHYQATQIALFNRVTALLQTFYKKLLVFVQQSTQLLTTTHADLLSSIDTMHAQNTAFSKTLEDFQTLNTWLDTLHIEQAILNTFKQQIHLTSALFPKKSIGAPRHY